MFLRKGVFLLEPLSGRTFFTGFVRRVFDKNDCRRVIIQVVPETKEKLLPVFALLRKMTENILEKYNDAQLAEIVDFIETCLEAVKNMGSEKHASR